MGRDVHYLLPSAGGVHGPFVDGIIRLGIVDSDLHGLPLRWSQQFAGKRRTCLAKTTNLARGQNLEDSDRVRPLDGHRDQFSREVNRQAEE